MGYSGLGSNDLVIRGADSIGFTTNDGSSDCLELNSSGNATFAGKIDSTTSGTWSGVHVTNAGASGAGATLELVSSGGTNTRSFQIYQDGRDAEDQTKLQTDCANGFGFNTNATFDGTISSNVISITTGGGAVGADFNGTTVGRGQLHLNRDDTATVKQIQFHKNGSEHSYLETTTSGLTIGGANTTFTGNIYSRGLSKVTAVTSLAWNAAIQFPEYNHGSAGAGFTPWLQGTSVHSAGYRRHNYIGEYRGSQYDGWGGGIFFAQGGNDNYATRYHMMNYDGNIEYYNGSSTKKFIREDNATFTNDLLTGGNGVYPSSNGDQYCGLSNFRFHTVYGVNSNFSSDQALKKNISTSDLGTDFIKSLNPVKFNWKKSFSDDTKQHYGFLAQEIKETPLLDSVDGEEGHMGMNYNELIAPIVKALQEALARIEVLENA